MQAMHQMLVRKGHAVHKTAKRPSRQQEKSQLRKEMK
jgi:hypothetical protein